MVPSTMPGAWPPQSLTQMGNSMRRLYQLRSARVVGLVVALAMTMTLATLAISHNASAGVGPLVWGDDFDGPAGSAPDPSKWASDTGGSGYGNNELEYYTDSRGNAALDGQGHLVITARRENPANYQCWYGQCQYTSARLTTSGRFSQTYGQVEARIELPAGQGAWPAFWMLGDDIGSVGWPGSGEIDVMENIGSEPDVIHGSMHGPGYSGASPLSAAYDLGQPVSAGFHTYTVDREPDSVTFSVDGHEYEHRTPADTNGDPWVFNQPFFLILNLAIGGNWPGSPDAATQFPMQMVVDYVHVNTLTDGPDATPTPTPAPSVTTSPGPTPIPSGGQGAGTVPAAAPITGFGGKCVDVRSANRRNGTRVQLFTCNNTDAQKWTRTGTTLQALGKCLDVSGADTGNGTRVQLFDCNATVAQDWQYSGGQLINPHSGKCLDATGPSSDDRTPLQIWDCHGGPNQQWKLTLPASPSPSPTSPPASPSPSGSPPANPAPTMMAASPYLYLGWGNPPDPRTVMSASGVKSFTLAFMLSSGGCQPAWDGQRPLTGGVDEQTINNIRSAGGDVVVSFGGASGPWLEQVCGSADALATAYRTVIDAYHLRAIDIDIEGPVYSDPASQQRTIDALKQVKASRPQVAVYVTIPADGGGPDGSMIGRAAQSGLAVDAWTIMPFDFGAAGQDMGALTAQAADGLARVLSNAYGYSSAQAYQHAGISSMNGITDAGETVTLADMQAILAYAQQHHLARLSFWSTNRDRSCNGGYRNDDTCSGVDQADWDFTRIVARYTG